MRCPAASGVADRASWLLCSCCCCIGNLPHDETGCFLHQLWPGDCFKVTEVSPGMCPKPSGGTLLVCSALSCPA